MRTLTLNPEQCRALEDGLVELLDGDLDQDLDDVLDALRRPVPRDVPTVDSLSAELARARATIAELQGYARVAARLREQGEQFAPLTQQLAEAQARIRQLEAAAAAQAKRDATPVDEKLAVCREAVEYVLRRSATDPGFRRIAGRWTAVYESCAKAYAALTGKDFDEVRDHFDEDGPASRGRDVSRG